MIDIPNEILIAARQGDQEASRQLVELMHRPIIATIYRFLGPAFRKDVEDIAQDIFLKVFRALDRFDSSRAKFTTWVYTFVRNHCFDVLKRKRIVTTSMHAVGDDESSRDFADSRELRPLQEAQNQELGRRIGEALQNLGEDQRMVFILREYEGLDYREIANVTGVNEGTVKSRLFRAKEALRLQLEPYLEAGA